MKPSGKKRQAVQKAPAKRRSTKPSKLEIAAAPLQSDAVAPRQVLEVHESAPAPFALREAGHWGQACTQWQLGDWGGLAALDLSYLEHQDHRAELAALAACAHLQLGDKTEARRCLAAASRWKCHPQFLVRALAAGVEASMARYHSLCGREDKEMRLLVASAGAFGGDATLAARARKALSAATAASAPNPARTNDPLLPPEPSSSPVAEKDAPLTLEEAIKKAKTEPSPFKPGITSYAQNFEDVMLWRALGHIENGFYIDIGAQHPVVDSVSKAFYEKGWRGIHVEPTRTYAEMLRKDRPDELVIQAAVSDRHGTLTLYEIPDTGMSTGEAAIAEMHRTRGFTIKQTRVPTITLADILALAGHREIHWLKIDVEGMEKRVLQGLARVQKKPWVLVIESTAPNSQINTHGDWEEIVLIAGYEFAYKDGLSRFYLHKRHSALSEKLNLPPNVFDMFIRY